jgi:multiple sugar transport system permease protein
VSSSFKDPSEIAVMPPKWIFQPTLSNYLTVIFKYQFFQNMLNSIVVTSVSTVLSLICGCLVAYSFARFKVRGRFYLSQTFILIRMLPPITVIIPLYIIMQRLGLIDTWLALILPYTGLNTVLVIWIMEGFFAGIPVDLEHAAMVDGCSRWEAFLRIVVPISKGGMGAAAILVAMMCWNEFSFAVILTEVNARTVPVAAMSFVLRGAVSWGPEFAALTLIIAPMIIFTTFAQSLLVRGLAEGAIKF